MNLILQNLSILKKIQKLKYLIKLVQRLYHQKHPLQKKNSSVVNTKKEISGNNVTSPIIGTAYLAPEPGGKKFVEVGKKIKKGDTIMIIEAMKTMNHVPSSFDGIVKEVCVSDGQPVEFGQTLIIIE